MNADVAVGDEVGIEVKRDFSNQNKHRLSGQITDYRKEFPCVIIVTCGIDDMDGWREFEREYGGHSGMSMEGSSVHFVVKRGEDFGGGGSGDDGGMFGDFIF